MSKNQKDSYWILSIETSHIDLSGAWGTYSGFNPL